jgi:dTDP-glucose 4,6-dehydratase
LIPKAVKCLNLDRKIPLHNDGTPIRNWLHAQDTANAIITIIESGVENEIYNVCGGFEQSNLETVEKILKEYFGDVNFSNYIDTTYSRQGQDVRYALDDSKLRTLGWEPKANFDQELKYIIEYYKNKFIW